MPISNSLKNFDACKLPYLGRECILSNADPGLAQCCTIIEKLTNLRQLQPDDSKNLSTFRQNGGRSEVSLLQQPIADGKLTT